LVLLAHAPELTDGNNSREIFVRFSHTGVTFGTLAVDGFFLLSGFLIVKSWQSDASLNRFLKKRFIRIAPGYAAAVIVSTLVVGCLAPGVAHFFRHIHGEALSGILFLYFPESLPVFPGNAYPILNSSLWTILYEFRCYVLVAIFGMLGLLTRRWIWLAVTCVLAVTCAAFLDRPLHWPHVFLYSAFGSPSKILRLTPVFFVGGCFFLYRHKIKFAPLLGCAALTLIVLTAILCPKFMEPALVVCGGYLLFYFTNRPLESLSWMRRVPDVSYGVYLYGFPVENLLVFRFHPSPWITFAVATLICFVLGWASWEFVEAPALRLTLFKPPAKRSKLDEQPVRDLVAP
jgi:peptidoglycan/LPS O-acetylase OafA/YrhL